MGSPASVVTSVLTWSSVFSRGSNGPCKELSFSFQKLLLKRALATVLRWGLSHNFSVRLYALVALKKIWGMCKTWQVEDLDAVTPVIESSLSQVENTHGAG